MAQEMEDASSLSDRFLESAADIWDTVTFNTNDLYNEPAPEPWISFMIGGIFSALGIMYWVIRTRKLLNAIEVDTMTASLYLRVGISAYIDNDSAAYTIIKMAAQSFLFLGGLQLDYRITFSAMLGFYGFESCGDALRILLAFKDAHSLADLVVTSGLLKIEMKNKVQQLKPNNVYEDLSRGNTIVSMVFITQCLLISFVVADIFDSDTHTCRDGTSGCPIVGTFGSWGFYLLGIFMADVYLLGPKTNFGQSEINPSYWLKLLLLAKTGTKCTWYDPVRDKIKFRVLYPSDWRIWLRFFMTFLINGVGFHILVHALPIQVAGQSSLTGVVFRAVGMMYLVDLDDTPGYTLTLCDDENQKDEAEDTSETDNKDEETPPPQDDTKPTMDEGEFAAVANHIIENARAQLDALAIGQGLPPPSAKVGGAMLLAGSVAATAAVPIAEYDNGENEQQNDVGGQEGGGQENGTRGLNIVTSQDDMQDVVDQPQGKQGNNNGDKKSAHLLSGQVSPTTDSVVVTSNTKKDQQQVLPNGSAAQGAAGAEFEDGGAEQDCGGGAGEF